LLIRFTLSYTLHNAVILPRREPYGKSGHSVQCYAEILTHTHHNAVIYPAKSNYCTH